MPSIDTMYGTRKPKPRPTTNRQVSGYNAQAYVPGGSTPRVAQAIQSKGQRPAAYQPPRAQPAPQPRPPAGPPPAQPTAPAAPPRYDYDEDPILQRIRGLTSRDRSSAQAEALAARKQVAIDYGDPDLARQFGDENTAQAAAGNPLGVRQQLRRSYDENTRAFEDALAANLFYSGYRGNELGRLGRGYQEGLAGATRQQQGLLSQIDRGLVDSLMGADDRDAEAEWEAAQRAIDLGLLGALAGEDLPGGEPVAAAAPADEEQALLEALKRSRLGGSAFEQYAM